jgi:hypothetical protein
MAHWGAATSAVARVRLTIRIPPGELAPQDVKRHRGTLRGRTSLPCFATSLWILSGVAPAQGRRHAAEQLRVGAFDTEWT